MAYLILILYYDARKHKIKKVSYLQATCSCRIVAPLRLPRMCKFKPPTNNNAKAAAVRGSELEECFTGYFVW